MSRNQPQQWPSAAGNIGSALGSFAQGYMNAKSMKREQEDRERNLLHEHADRLRQTLESPLAANNKSMRESLMIAYADALDKADAGPQKKTKQEGVGGLLKRVFGIGGYDAAPDQGGQGPMRTMLENSEKERQAKLAQQPTALPQQQPGSGTYGSLDFGPATGQGPTAQPTTPWQNIDGSLSQRSTGLPQMPGEAAPQTPAWKREPHRQYSSLVDANGDFNPVESQGSVAEQSMAKAMPAPTMPSPAAQYATQQRTPQSPPQGNAQQTSATARYAQQRPSYDSIIQQAQQQHTGRFGIQDPPDEIKATQSRLAKVEIDNLFDLVDSFIDVTPGHETFDQAYANPTVRQALDGIKDLAPLYGHKFEDLISGRFAAKPEEAAEYEQATLSDVNGNPFPVGYDKRTNNYYPPGSTAAIPNPQVYEKPPAPGSAPPPSTRVFDFLIAQGLNPEEAMKKVNKIDQTEPNARQKYENGLMNPQESAAFVARIRALDKPGAENIPVLEKYRISTGSSLNLKTGIQTSGGQTYDVGGLRTALDYPEKTGVTIPVLQAAIAAYRQADPNSADAKALEEVVFAFGRKTGR